MIDYIKPFCTPVAKAIEDYGELVGSGTYTRVQNRTFILTNQHVANSYRINGQPAHRLLGKNKPHLITGHYGQLNSPIDIALMPVSREAWSSNHSSKFLTLDMMCEKHSPTRGEMLVFLGFTGQRSKFLYGTLATPATGNLRCDVTSLGPDTKYLFDLDYHPERTERVVGNRPLPVPNGLSGSAVWNTGFIESRIAGTQWAPNLAMVTGVVCLWSEAHGCLRATRCEHIKPWLTITQPPPEMLIKPTM